MSSILSINQSHGHWTMDIRLLCHKFLLFDEKSHFPTLLNNAIFHPNFEAQGSAFAYEDHQRDRTFPETKTNFNRKKKIMEPFSVLAQLNSRIQ